MPYSHVLWKCIFGNQKLLPAVIGKGTKPYSFKSTETNWISLHYDKKKELGRIRRYLKAGSKSNLFQKFRLF
jgi:hypothetical protein